MKSRMQCKESQAVLNDPDFRLEFTTSNGQTVALSNGSFCTAISASDGSNIEGESFKFIICEECFPRGTKILTRDGYRNIEDIKKGDMIYSYNHKTKEVELKEVNRSFSQPLYNRKMSYISTKSGNMIECTDNHKFYVINKGKYVRADQLEVGDKLLKISYQEGGNYCGKNRVESDASRNNVRGREYSLSRQEILKESKINNKSYRKTEKLRNEKVQPTERFMQPRTKSCEESREGRIFSQIYNEMLSRYENLLRFILPWRKKGSVERNIGFNDRRSLSLLVSRRWKFFWNDVYSHTRVFFRGESATSRMVKGKIQCTVRDKDRQKNRQTFPIFQRNREEQISKINSSIHGGFNDVQDRLDRRENSMCNLWENGSSLSQKESSILFRELQKREPKKIYEGILYEEEVTEVVLKHVDEVEVFDLTVEDNHNFFAEGILVHNCQDISNFKIRKSIHPMGAAYNATICKIGTATTFKGDFFEAIERNKKEYEEKKIRIRNHFEYNYKVVMKYNPRYAKYVEREKRSLGENSDEFQMSYNLKWIISRGMFVDMRKVEKDCGEPYLDRVMQDYQSTNIAGIDLGGGSSSNKSSADSTVITIVEVDWNNPVVMESETDPETGEDIVYLRYNTYIKDWLEIPPELCEDYEEQYHMIMDYLSNFNISRIVCDATRESSIAHRIRANVKCEVIPFVFSTKSKSEIYKHLDSEIKTGRARFPMGEETVQTREYKKFVQQLEDLQKSYSGQYLVVSHPPERNAHDDYPDSWCLAVWGAKDKGEIDNTETRDFRKMVGVYGQNTITRMVNRRTGRRR